MATAEKTLEELEQEAIDALASGERRTATKVLYSLAGALSFFAVWAAFAELVFEPFILPSPIAVARRMGELTISGEVFTNFLSSFLKTMAGWAMAFVLGTPIGLLMGRYRYARAFFHDFVYLFANVPLLVYAVIAIVVFGISPWGPAFVVMLEAFTGIAINVAAGVESVDRGLLAMSRSFRRTSGKTLRSVVVPSVVPFLFASGRVSFANSWKLAALAETFGGYLGVGYQLEKAFQMYSVELLLAWMFFFVLFVVLVERLLIAPAERRVFAWRDPAGARERVT
ncbi:MAG TPA: ABC transporter permease subunit [Actinomycetota bacterium]|nr:ABC transporter permease subunit [Actinomycetota bacterium]